MIDQIIADLEEELFQVKTLLKFFRAYLCDQPGRQIKVADRTMATMHDEEEIYVVRDESCNSTIIGFK